MWRNLQYRNNGKQLELSYFSDKKLIDYKNLIFYFFGTIYHYPKINEKKLINHYQTAYRKTESSINLKAKTIPRDKILVITQADNHLSHYYEIILNKEII